MASKVLGQSFGTLARITEPAVGDNGEDEEVDVEDGVLFYVNKNGFPIDEATWARMWTHVAKINPSGCALFDKVRNDNSFKEVPFPQVPFNLPPSMLVAEKLEIIQNYMSALEYNHTGTQFFEIKKNRPISGLMDSAKEMIKESLPIKCLEAVILGLYLTNGIAGLDRFTISFKTSFNGGTYRHVVLGMYSNGRYGALGMSRRQDLMYKPLRYKHLSDLVVDYEESYSKYWHQVKKIKVGLPVPHDSHSYETIDWKTLSMTIPKMSREEIIRESDRFAREMKSVTKKWNAKVSAYLAHSKHKNLAQEASTVSGKKSMTPSGHKANQASKTVKKRDSPTKKEKKSMKIVDVINQDSTPSSASETQGTPNMTTVGKYQIRV